MKKVYTDDYLSRRSRRKPRASAAKPVSRAAARPPRAVADPEVAPQAGAVPAGTSRQARHAAGRRARADSSRTKLRKPRVIALALLLILIFLFFVSCLLTLADANSGPAIAESAREYRAPAGTKAEAPGVWANAAVLTDIDSGRILYDKNSHVKLPMASTTKMMTALVVRERCKLDDKVKVSAEATQVGEEAINLIEGETLTVEQLLNVMLIQSANDAAYALAQHAGGGSVDAFMGMMNKTATDLGATDSHFTNPHGLDQSEHYSSAYDLAVIGRAVMLDPVLSKIVATPKYSIPTPGQTWNRVAVGHNEILTRYEGACGIKTGYTGKAGMCLAASAKRDGKGLVAVVLNSSHRADDVSALFNYGFNNTARIVFATQGQKLGTSRVSSFPKRSVKVVASQEMASLTFLGSNDVFKVVTSVQNSAPSPVKAGQKLGTVVVLLNNARFESSNAVSSQAKSGSNFLGVIGAFFWYSACWVGRIISAPFRIF